jgi:hypothetical protein
LLPLRGNKKQEFGLWVAGATHVGFTCFYYLDLAHAEFKDVVFWCFHPD